MKKLPIHFVPATFLALALTASIACAQAPAAAPGTPATTTSPAATAKPKALAEPEKKFFKDVSEALLIEQKLALMGSKDAKGKETKDTTSKINDDLKKVWEKFATLSMEKGATIASDVPKSDANKAERIAKQKEEKFDKDLLDDLGKEAKKTTRLFETKTLQDPEVKQFASDWAPTIKGHEAAIEKAEKALGKKAN